VDRRYWRLWAASTISNLGDGVAIAAFPLLAASLTRDPFLLSLLGIAQYLPWLLFSLIAGALVDRWDRRLVMWRVDVLRAVIVGGLAMLVAVDRANLPLIFAAAFVLGTAETLFDNASQAILPSLVERPLLPKANGRLYSGQIVGNQFVGPPLGGLLFAVAAATPFFLDAGSFVGAAVLVAFLPGNFRAERASTADTTDAGADPGATAVVREIRQDIAEGLRWLWHHRVLRTLALVLGAINLMYEAAIVVLVLFAQDVLGLGDAGYGLLISSFAVGSVVGSLTAERLIRRLGPGVTLGASLIVMGGCQAAIGALSVAWQVGLFFVVIGFWTVVWNVITVSLRQSIIPDALLGRVNSAYRFVGWGAIPVGSLVGGLLADAFGLRAPFVIGGLAMVAMAAVMAPMVNTRTIEAAQSEADATATPAPN
jgi:MFS family permease